MRGPPIWLGLTCAFVAALGATQAPVARASQDHRTVRAGSERRPLGDERLSDEQRLSRYAGAVSLAPVRTRPNPNARPLSVLHYLTQDGTFEVYPVLESRVDQGGSTWLRIRLPMRPNGLTGWVPRGSLGPLKMVRTKLTVNRATLRATLYRDGRPIWSSPVGVGKASTPTPAGHFWIRSRLRGLDSNPVYGPYAFGTADYSVLTDWPGGGVIGIHGTNEPQLIPGRPSHGCIRVPNAAITRLWQLMPIGTPIAIL